MKKTIIRLTAIIALAATLVSGASAFASAKSAVQTNEVTITECAARRANKEYQRKEYKTDENTKVVTVSFKSSRGKYVPSPVKVVVGETYKVLKAPSNVQGYKFAGWSLNGKMISNSSIVTATDDHVLTAVWVKTAVK